MMRIVITLLVGLVALVTSHPEYQAKIPNGNKVPNPCNPSQVWGGVGHQSAAGGDARNPFGLDFAANNHVWNAALCGKDSDGDGKTNGQELGDPNCSWTEGGTPSGSAQGHPGVCEPLDKPECVSKNSFITCKAPTTLPPAVSPVTPSAAGQATGSSATTVVTQKQPGGSGSTVWPSLFLLASMALVALTTRSLL